jgi:hypothetical protein
MRLPRMFATLAAAALTATSLGAQAPKRGFRAEFLGQWKGVQTKFEQLAKATPWEKYSWRPGAGVRSVCEVFLHIGGDNYMLGKEIGAKVPASVDFKTVETCPDSKEKVLATMKGGFDAFTDAVMKMSDADAEKAVKVFGMEFTYRGYLSFNLEHAGEHLGQSIAYARMNGITPPWSAK